jgi:RNA polymerase sigma-70 factor (ECF subfamily)
LDDPAGAAVDRASLRLAFVAAMQHLSARERAALILRDVLAFSAAETADVLDMTVASVNSALQRTRARLRRDRVLESELAEPSQADQRASVDRYMRAFERANLAGLKQLLADDVILEMPPMLNWFTGRENYAEFVAWVFAKRDVRWRLHPIAANGQPGFAAYWDGAGTAFELHTAQFFDIGTYGIRRVTVFQDAEVFAVLGLPEHVDT